MTSRRLAGHGTRRQSGGSDCELHRSTAARKAAAGASGVIKVHPSTAAGSAVAAPPSRPARQPAQLTQEAAAGDCAQGEQHAAHALPPAQPAGGHPALVLLLVLLGCRILHHLCRHGCCGRGRGERRWRLCPLCRRRLLLPQGRGHALPGAAAWAPGATGGRQRPQEGWERRWPQALSPSQAAAAAGCWSHKGHCSGHAGCRGVRKGRWREHLQGVVPGGLFRLCAFGGCSWVGPEFNAWAASGRERLGLAHCRRPAGSPLEK